MKVQSIPDGVVCSYPLFFSVVLIIREFCLFRFRMTWYSEGVSSVHLSDLPHPGIIRIDSFGVVSLS